MDDYTTLEESFEEFAEENNPGDPFDPEDAAAIDPDADESDDPTEPFGGDWPP